MSRLICLILVSVTSINMAFADDVSFLNEEKKVPAGKEWLREIGAKQGGQIVIRIKGPSTYSVTLITDAAYKALNSGGEPKREDMIFSSDSKKESFEKTATLKKGTYWIIIENKTRQETTFHLECAERK
jgi:hypothetical protein